MNLETGMYIRYIAGNYQNDINKKIVKIGKITIITNLFIELDNHDSFIKEFLPSAIIGKPTFDIIDLIEVGDYVNGCRVIKTNLEPPLKYVKCINDNCFKENEIKTIVTKEQFESNCYKIGDE